MKLSKSTIVMYENHFKRLKERLIDPYNRKELIAYLDTIPPNTAMINLKALRHFANKDAFDELLGDLLGKYQIVENTTPKNRELKGTIEDLIQAVKFYEDNPEAQLIMLFYLNFPLRNDIGTIKLRSFNNKDNYISEGQLVLNSYKTSKVYGAKSYLLTDKMKELLKLLNGGQDYLFMKNGKMMDKIQTSKLVGDLYKKALGKKLTITDTRNIKISKEYEGVDVQKMLDLANKYNHKLDVQAKYYVRN